MKVPSQQIVVLAVIMFVFPVLVLGQVMQSSSYKLERDSVNFGGGNSSSSNYSQESTFGEVATGDSQSTNYVLHAGYQQMVATYLSLSVSSVNLTPAINTTGGGIANGSTTVSVTTDDAAGYELYIVASSSPALISGANSFADYTPAGVNPDFAFTVASANSAFGFSPEGSDIVQAFKDNGSTCNTGSSDTANACWNGLSTTNQLVAKKSSANHPTGSNTVLEFRAESGSSHVQPSGTYTATTTVTAVAL